ncbi:MAG: aminomethyl-transferring glycine dehydrogenase subunit GcvPB [Lachnospiraceae bacterium]|nr:aminomethyl-transferring glycine dehydrogenase subunit GcvPB [Lachnospiraceae bacterium]
MKLIFEKSIPGRHTDFLPALDVPEVSEDFARRIEPLRLPELSEVQIDRHYTELAGRTRGVNGGFYPLGSCTMKYNPALNERVASLPGFTDIHPLQDDADVQGCLEVMKKTEEYLAEITGMDAVSLQPAAGAHGEFTGLLLIRAYHRSRGDEGRTKIIVPDSAHGTNPASAVMAGFEVVNIPSDAQGYVDLAALKAAVGPDTAGLMLTNPNTVGLFDPNIEEITRIVHEAGGLNYYDGANLNAVMGIVRPGDMGFDVVHVNLHKTFSTPHGGGGPGSGPSGCKAFLAPFLPGLRVTDEDGTLHSGKADNSIGDMRSFRGNFLVIVKALAYILSIGREGVKETAENAVLNANYMMRRLSDVFDMAYDSTCMHEFVMTLERLKDETGVSALDFAKALTDCGIHPPTMYFPLIVHEALMVEPTETEPKETLDAAVEIFRKVMEEAYEKPEEMHLKPLTTVIRRPDEVKAARKPVVRYDYPGSV